MHISGHQRTNMMVPNPNPSYDETQKINIYKIHIFVKSVRICGTRHKIHPHLWSNETQNQKLRNIELYLIMSVQMRLQLKL